MGGLQYQIPYFSNTKVDNIRHKYEGYFAHVTKEMGKTPTQSTMGKHHAGLKHILDEALLRGWATNNTLPKLSSEGKESTRRPTFEMSEYRSLIVKITHWSQKKSHRNKDNEIRKMLYDYVLILVNSGIRHGREAMEIKWSNISFGKSKSGKDIITMVAIKRKGRKATEERRKVVVRHNSFSDFKKILERIKERNPTLNAMTVDQIIKKRMDVLLFCLSDGTQPARLGGTFKNSSPMRNWA
jgi:integrase